MYVLEEDEKCYFHAQFSREVKIWKLKFGLIQSLLNCKEAIREEIESWKKRGDVQAISENKHEPKIIIYHTIYYPFPLSSALIINKFLIIVLLQLITNYMNEHPLKWMVSLSSWNCYFKLSIDSEAEIEAEINKGYGYSSQSYFLQLQRKDHRIQSKICIIMLYMRLIYVGMMHRSHLEPSVCIFHTFRKLKLI